MNSPRNTFIASLIVVTTGVLWGFYWLPAREIAQYGLTGAWGTVAIVLAATLLLCPLGWRGRAALRASHPLALVSVALGGFAFFLYSVGFLYGQVAIIVILFFLTPVWSTLIGRYFLGWPISGTRIFVLIIGLLGLVVMLGADGDIPVPHGLGEWLGLASGVLWAIATVGIRTKATAGPGETAFVFAAGALGGGIVLSLWIAPLPNIQQISSPSILALYAVLTGAIWWAASMVGLMWAATKLEPARVGILLMAEVVIAPLSAALIVGEHLTGVEIIGGLLVFIAGALEVFPTRKRSRETK